MLQIFLHSVDTTQSKREAIFKETKTLYSDIIYTITNQEGRIMLVNIEIKKQYIIFRLIYMHLKRRKRETSSMKMELK